MSPEQADGELAGPETDVYSLALTAYECWAGAEPGRRPHPGADRAPDRRRAGAAARAPARPAGGARRHDRRLPRCRARAAPRARRAARLPRGRSCRCSTDRPPAARAAARPTARSADARPRPIALAGGRSPRARRPSAPRRRARARRPLLPSLIVGAPALAGPVGGPLGGRRARRRRRGARRGAERSRSRVLGAVAWAWLLAGALALGARPGSGSPTGARRLVGEPALVADARSALLAVESLLGARRLRARASVALGWVLARAPPGARAARGDALGGRRRRGARAGRQRQPRRQPGRRRARRGGRGRDRVRARVRVAAGTAAAATRGRGARRPPSPGAAAERFAPRLRRISLRPPRVFAPFLRARERRNHQRPTQP